jgi:hypothetical protein
MKTKEEILEQKIKTAPSVEYNPFYEAMDEYAKQQAIAFFKWCIDSYSIGYETFPLIEDTICHPNGEVSLGNAYELYLNSKK